MLQDTALVLNLLCAVSFNMNDTSTTSINPTYGQPPVTGAVTSRREVHGETLVQIGEANRIRLPHHIVRSRDDGWRELTDLSVNDDRITAKFQYKFAETGTLDVDRMTGEIRARMGNVLAGYYNLVGRCFPQEVRKERLF